MFRIKILKNDQKLISKVENGSMIILKSCILKIDISAEIFKQEIASAWPVCKQQRECNLNEGLFPELQEAASQLFINLGQNL